MKTMLKNIEHDINKTQICSPNVESILVKNGQYQSNIESPVLRMEESEIEP